jgi:GH3 auxin-responsive promoter
MRGPLFYRALNSLPLAGFRRGVRHFESALADPEEVQQRLLLDLLKKNRASAFGRQCGFESIRSVREYQNRMPVATYDDLAPWIERIQSGEREILTNEPVLAFEKSSGSASAAKYIPYTQTLQRQFQSALAPWITDIHRAFPRILRGCAYWVVTPLSREREVTDGGVPVGFESDAEYFGPIQRWVLRKTMAVPPELAQVRELEDCIYLTLRFLLQARSLAFISLWSPSFLLILLDRLQQQGERLVRDLCNGNADVVSRISPKLTRLLRRDARQAENLRAMLRRGQIEAAGLWPQLALISCWTSAASASMKSEVEQRFPGVVIQGKGLLATEGVVSIPIEQYGAPLAAVTSHFLEFFDEHSGECRLVAELDEGREYQVILTTGGGLWRYRLGDRVRVVGFAKRTPLLEFVGKEDCVSDLRGEKLNAVFVASMLAEFECCRIASFAMLAPTEAGFPFYTLFLESSYCQPDLALRLDQRLQANPHYAYCRRIGQLGELRIFRINRDARNSYVDHCAALGQRAGSVKMTSLDKRFGWEHVFSGTYLQAGMTEVCA